MERKHIEVVAAVIHRGNEYFATQRGYGDYKGWWEFPGGKIEAGETSEEALCREIREELHTDIAVERLLVTVHYDYPKFHMTMYCYLCHVVHGELELVEASDSCWFTPSDAPRLRWLPSDVEVIEALRRLS